MANKTMNEILEKIKGTSEIVSFIKPVYNFKASEKYIPGVLEDRKTTLRRRKQKGGSDKI